MNDQPLNTEPRSHHKLAKTASIPDAYPRVAGKRPLNLIEQSSHKIGLLIEMMTNFNWSRLSCAFGADSSRSDPPFHCCLCPSEYSPRYQYRYLYNACKAPEFGVGIVLIFDDVPTSVMLMQVRHRYHESGGADLAKQHCMPGMLPHMQLYLFRILRPVSVNAFH